MSNEIQLSDGNFEQEVLKSAQPVLVDFWAEWCGPCKMIAPLIEELSKEYGGRVKVCKVNVDECPDSSAKYHIQAIPTLMFFKGGKPVAEMVGLKSRDELKRRLDELLA